MGYIGIDYSLGRSNFDPKTGIHFGVISMHSIMLEVTDDFEYDYGKPTCPECLGEAQDVTEYFNQHPEAENWPNYSKHGCDDYVCPTCQHSLDSCEVFSEEALGFTYERDGYKLTDCLDSDIFVLESPFYTFAQYCSPCVPGAGNLNTPMENGVKTYALGHDWFESGKAHYKVYKVADDTEVV